MKSSQLQQCIFDQVKIMQNMIKAYKRKQKGARLHQLRLAIKQVRALVFFAENIFQKNYSVKALKPAYTLAGTLRETALNIQLLKTLDNFPAHLIKNLEKREMQYQTEFVTRSSELLNDLKTFKRKFVLPQRSMSHKSIKGFFKQEINEKSELLNKPTKTAVHDYRKHLKKLLYVYQILPKTLRKELPFNEEKTNKLQEKIGDWHNLYSSLNYLKKQNKSNRLSQITNQLNLEEEEAFAKLLTLLC